MRLKIISVGIELGSENRASSSSQQIIQKGEWRGRRAKARVRRRGSCLREFALGFGLEF